MTNILDESTRRAVREAMGGDPDVPVTLNTTSTGFADHGHPEPASPPQVVVSPDEVLAELQRMDPRLVELAATRVGNRVLLAEVERLRGLAGISGGGAPHSG